MINRSIFRFLNGPRWALILGFVVALVMAVMDHYFHYQFNFSWQEVHTKNNTIDGWRVTHSQEPLLSNGELLTHVRTPQHRAWMVLDNTALLPTFDFSGNEAQIKHALEFDDALYQARDSEIEFKTSDGRVVHVRAHKTPWQKLGGEFWLHKGTYLVFASMMVLLSVLYTHSKNTKHAPNSSSVTLLSMLFLLAGFSVIFPNSSADRQMGMPAEYVWWRFFIEMLVIQITSMLYLHLMLREPINLLKQSSALSRWLIVGVMVVNYCVCANLMWAMYVKQDNLIQILHFSKPVSFLTFIVLTALQFIKTRARHVNILDRLAFDVVIKCVVLVLIFYGLFGFLIKQYWLSLAYKPSVMLAIMGLLIALALMMIVFRHYIYKIFNWWWVFNSIALGGITILLSLMFSSDYGRQYELMPSLISILAGVSIGLMVGFFYQFKEAQKGVSSLVKASASLQKISGLKLEDPAYWPEQKNVFQSALNANHAEIIDVKPDTLELLNENEQLKVHIFGQKGIVLSQPDYNKRLFNDSDLKIVALLRDLSTAPQREYQAYMKGEKQTRQQVAHDLHDDIGGRLHQLAHGDIDNAPKYAQKTLEQLRTLTHALHQDAQPLEDFLYDVRYEVQRYGQTYPVDLVFSVYCEPNVEKTDLSANAMMQFKSIISELCRNALQHEGTKNINVSIAIHCDKSEILIENDGDHTQVQNWVTGVGTVSIKRRAHQLGGHVTWEENKNGGVIARVVFSTNVWQSH